MENQEYIVTPQGSLGILALGHVGIRKWREIVQKEKDKKEKNQNQKENAKQK
jgi:hypothetical protein